MHLYFYARGVQHQVEVWKIFAQTQFWRLRRTNLKTGKAEDKIVQGGLRPTIFGAYEYIFPKEALPEVLAVFGINERNHNDTIKDNLRIFGLRKMFGLKKIPKEALKLASTFKTTFYMKNSERGFSDCKIQGVEIHAFGIKEDRMFEIEGYHQEAL